MTLNFTPMNFDYDLFIIGAGPGGMAAAERTTAYGAKVAIAEREQVGGNRMKISV